MSDTTLPRLTPEDFRLAVAEGRVDFTTCPEQDCDRPIEGLDTTYNYQQVDVLERLWEPKYDGDTWGPMVPNGQVEQRLDPSNPVTRKALPCRHVLPAGFDVTWTIHHPRVYRRDVSWHNSGRGGSAYVFHWPSPTDPGMARCQPSRIMLPDGEPDATDPAKVTEGARCTGSGCRQEWARWAAKQDVSGQGAAAPATVSEGER